MGEQETEKTMGDEDGLGLGMKMVRRMCELRAEGLGLGRVMHEGLGLEQGLGLGLGNTYGLGLGLRVKIAAK